MRADLGSQEANNIRQQLQRLLQVVHEHKTLADFVNAALEVGHASAKSLEELKGEMDSFANSLIEFLREARVACKKILKMIVLFRQRAQTRDDNMRARILQIESVIGGFPRPQSPPTFHSQVNNSPRVGDTPLGTVVVGGLDTVITANLLFNLICKLQGKVNLLTTRAKQNCVFYNGLAFSSESELSGWFTLHNPLGAGCAAMVDFQSIWSYSDSDTADSSSWLNDMEKS